MDEQFSAGSEEHERAASQAGRGMEYLRIAGGRVLIMDQFMLANEQFISKFRSIPAGAASEAVEVLAEQYGGCVLDLTSGTYRVYRDPQENIIALSRLEEEGASAETAAGDEPPFDFRPIIDAKATAAPSHHVFVDTRCLVFLDLDLLQDRDLIDEYRRLREAGNDKEARDLLRSKGGAVRYGFNRYGDELGVFSFPDENLAALWPDVID